MTLSASGRAVMCVGVWTFGRSGLEAVLSANLLLGTAVLVVLLGQRSTV